MKTSSIHPIVLISTIQFVNVWAVWSKTGKWTTLQADKWLGTTNFTSRIAIAGLSIASLSAVAIPFAGLMLAGSDINVARDEKKKKKGESNNSSIITKTSLSHSLIQEVCTVWWMHIISES